MSVSRRKKILLKLVLLGGSRTGKTSLLRRYVNNKFHAGYKSTIGADFLTKEILMNETWSTLQIWDTSGQETFDALGGAFYKGTDGCILVYDVSNQESFSSLEKIREKFLEISSPANVVFAIVGTKSDLNRLVSEKEVAEFAAKHNIKIVCDISLKNDEGYPALESFFREFSEAILAFKTISEAVPIVQEKPAEPTADDSAIGKLKSLFDGIPSPSFFSGGAGGQETAVPATTASTETPLIDGEATLNQVKNFFGSITVPSITVPSLLTESPAGSSESKPAFFDSFSFPTIPNMPSFSSESPAGGSSSESKPTFFESLSFPTIPSLSSDSSSSGGSSESKPTFFESLSFPTIPSLSSDSSSNGGSSESKPTFFESLSFPTIPSLSSDSSAARPSESKPTFFETLSFPTIPSLSSDSSASKSTFFDSFSLPPITIPSLSYSTEKKSETEGSDPLKFFKNIVDGNSEKN